MTKSVIAKKYFTYDMVRIMLFLQKHNRERFSFSELKNMHFFSNGTRLNDFLKFAVGKDLLKKTMVKCGSRTYAMYEIRAWANDFADYLEKFV
jgi:hypothetical protein